METIDLIIGYLYVKDIKQSKCVVIICVEVRAEHRFATPTSTPLEKHILMFSQTTRWLTIKIHFCKENSTPCISEIAGLPPSSNACI